MTKLQHKQQPALVLGTTVEGNKVVTLTGIDFERHKHIIGISGSGKSSFLASCALLLLRQGVPFTLVDPTGDLATLILSLLASSDFFRNPKAFDRLWYVDCSREDRFVPFNVLKQPYEPHTIANNLLEATHRAFPVAGTTASLDNMLLAGALVLVENGLPLTALNNLIIDRHVREGLLRNVTDPLVVQFFKSKFEEKVSSQLVDSTLRRSFLFTFSPALRNSLGQKENKLNFRALMDNQTSCIFNLGGLDDNTKRFLGCLLMVGLEQAFLSRANIPAEKRTPYHVIVDEFPLFCASENSFAVVMEQCRKYGGVLYLSHQTTSQLSKGITGSLQNAISILFKLGYEDSTWASQRFVRKQEMQEPGLLDLFLGTSPRQSSPFAQVKTLQEAKHVFENVPRAEAIVTINNQTLHVRTPTVPHGHVDDRKRTEIENEYARRLLTPLATIERERTASNLVLVSSAPAIIKRRTYAPAQKTSRPLALFTGDLEHDIRVALTHFPYATLQQLATLLSKEKSVNYLRKKLSTMTEENKVAVTLLPRVSGGKPLQVYWAPGPGERKHQFLEHTLDCSAALIAGFHVPTIEPSLTLTACTHERTLKATFSSSSIIPDGLLSYQTQAGEIITLALEIDRNTENTSRVEQKFTGYPAWIQRMGIDALTIAFLVTAGGMKRVTALMERAKETIGESDLASLFLFACVPIETMSPRMYLDPVFRGLDTSLHALLEKPL